MGRVWWCEVECGQAQRPCAQEGRETDGRKTIHAGGSHPHGVVTPTAEGFRVEAALEGTSARDLNRILLSALRRIDRRSTMHAAWTSKGTTEHFFDYTARGTRSAQTPETNGDVNH